MIRSFRVALLMFIDKAIIVKILFLGHFHVQQQQTKGLETLLVLLVALLPDATL
jgi:hypothetical protein